MAGPQRSARAVGDLARAGHPGRLRREQPRLSLSEIAERSGTPLTTAHRLLAELTEWGALVRRPDGRYEIGRKLWDLGLLAPVQLELRQVAAPFLMDVHTAIRDTVHLAVRDGLSALYVERVSGRESVPVVSTVGSRLPLHATGVGKVLLAAAPPEVEQGAPLADPGHPPHRGRPGPAAPASWPRCAGAGTPGRRRRCHRARRRSPCRCRSTGRAGRSWWPRSASSSRRTAGTCPGSCRCSRSPPAASAGSWPAPAISTDRKFAVPSGGAPGHTRAVRTQVGIIGAGPAGLLLSRLLTLQGIDNVVLENRSRDYVEARIRAGILEQHTVDTLTAAGVGDRLQREGLEHRGIYLQYPGTPAQAGLPRALRPHGVGLRADRGHQGPDQGAAGRRPAAALRRLRREPAGRRQRRTRGSTSPTPTAPPGARVRRHRRHRRLPRRRPARSSAGRRRPGVGAHLSLCLARHPGRRRRRRPTS